MGFIKVIQILSVLISSFLVDSVHSLEEGSSYFFYQRPIYPRDCQEVLEQCTTHTASGVYLIRPDGYDEAFEVYCDHQVDGGGWTVFQRRNENNSLEFRRTFSEYSEGFGFLGSEFWIGNKRLSFLTNQKRYELRIDMVNSAGSSFYITYDLFRISDEWNNFKLVSTGQYGGTADNFITKCPTISPSGDCASSAPSNPTDCYDIFTSGITEDGVYSITPTGWTESPFHVYCNMSNGGGWTVFQRRVNGSVDFQFRDWEAHKEGFGFPNHELWLGNEKLFLLTNQKNYKLRVDYVDRDGVPYFMNYDLFRVANETTNYQLELLGTFTGNSGFDYMAYHKGRPFTTRDRDNDARDGGNCAVTSRGGWWYGDCYNANLNGDYSHPTDHGVALYSAHTSGYKYALRYTQMKLRPA